MRILCIIDVVSMCIPSEACSDISEDCNNGAGVIKRQKIGDRTYDVVTENRCLVFQAFKGRASWSETPRVSWRIPRPG
jgi:hypothetical protein